MYSQPRFNIAQELANISDNLREKGDKERADKYYEAAKMVAAGANVKRAFNRVGLNEEGSSFRQGKRAN